MTPPPRTPREWWAAGAIAALAFSGWVALACISHDPGPAAVRLLMIVLALQWGLALRVRHRPEAFPTAFWIACGIAFRIVGCLATPILEDDHFRFLWDGRTFAETGNPYGRPPSNFFADPGLSPRFADILDRVNHPDVPTIYGPVLQFTFVLAHQIAPGALWPWKLFLLGADVLLILALRHRPGGPDGDRAAIFAAWCPLSIFESSFNAHPEGLAVALAAAAMLAGRRNHGIASAILAALAVATRIHAVVLVPFLARRDPRRWLVFGMSLAFFHAPFWLQGTTAGWEGLRNFGTAWEFNSSIHALLSVLLGPHTARRACGIAFLILWALLIARNKRRHPDELPPGQTLFLGLFLLAPTFNPWYALWILPFVALQPTATGVTTLAGVSLAYLTRQNLGEAVLDGFAHPAWVRPLEFGLIAAAMLTDALRRRPADQP